MTSLIIKLAAVAIIVGVCVGVGTYLVVSPPPVEEYKYIKIGSITALNHAYCVQCTQGSSLAVEDINEEGGLSIGGEKYFLEFISYDSRMLVDEAVTSAKRLLEMDNVRHIVFMGPSSGAMAMLPNIEDFIDETGEDIVVMASGSGATAICTDYGGSIVFRERPTSYVSGMAHARFVIEEFGPKFGIVMSNDEYGVDIAKGLQDGAEKYGGEVVSVEWYEYGEVNFTPQLTKLIDLQPDTIVVGHHATYIYGIIKQAYDLGTKEIGIHVHMAGTITKEETTEIIGAERAEGLTAEIASAYPYYLEEGVPEVVAFVEKVEQRFAVEVGGGHPCGYTAVRLLAKAMEIAGTTNPTAIKSALREMKIEDIEDELWFKVNPLSPVDEEGHVYDETGQGMSYYTAIVFSGGELVPLRPLMG